MSAWNIARLVEVCVEGGIQTGPFGSQLHQSDYSQEGTPVIMPKDIKGGTVDEEGIARVEERHVERLARHKVKRNNIVFPRRGDVAKEAFITEREEGWLCGTGCLKVVLNEDIVSPEFIRYQLSLPNSVKWLETHAVGSTMPNINSTILGDLPITLPPLPTQRRIASILSDYDSAIANARKQIESLEEAAMRLYREWFDCDESKGWEKRSILDNDIFRFVNQRIKKFEGSKIYYATADVDCTSIVAKGELITFNKRPSRASIQPVVNSVWFARMSNSYKILGFTECSSGLEDRCILSSGFAGFTSSPECFGYVYYYIASKKFDEDKNRYATGATQVSLTNEGLAKMIVRIPPMDKVRRYSQIVMPMLNKCEMLRVEIRTLTEARDRLLPKLMSGEIDVMKGSGK